MSRLADFIAVAEPTFSVVAVVAALASVVAGIFAATRSFSKVRFGGLEFSLQAKDIEQTAKASERPEKPFETTALANYYNQVLSRANISFWFSIIFASIGFGVIIFAFLTHNSADTTGSVIKVSSGVVIDAVSSLFFFQSTNAQKSMAEFFEKLRLDRLNAEAREMIAEIEDGTKRDQLRAQIILKYSGIEKLLTDIDMRSRAEGKA